MRRNEIWWAELPAPAGRRPVLLLSRDEAYRVRRKVIVAEITTTIRRIPTEVIVGRSEGLPKKSVINTENLWTVPMEWLKERAGALTKAKIEAVDEGLRFALELD